MPLSEMSPNIQETETGGRKRSHSEFSGDESMVENQSESKSSDLFALRSTDNSLIPPVQNATTQSPPAQGSPALTEAGSSTAARNSPSPGTPGQPSNDHGSANATLLTAATTTQPIKKTRLTQAEREERDRELAERRAERERERLERAAVKAQENARAEEEKAARAREREKRAAVKAVEAAEKAAKNAALAEEKRRKKEAEEKVRAQKAHEKEEQRRKKEEAKEKEERKQPRLSSFFGAPSTPKKSGPAASFKDKSPQKLSPATAGGKPIGSEYERLFKPFFLKEHTKLAQPAISMDDQTKEAKSCILDEFIRGERTHSLDGRRFDAVEIFALPERPHKRGKLHHPVKHIMESLYKHSEVPSRAAGDKSSGELQEVVTKLARIPMKVIAFSQDVRPPYYGTVTFQPCVLGKNHMRKLARRTMAPRLPLDYSYDSEAEWQEDEGEDVDMDDDDEEIDDEDDMDGFLDDSEDNGPSRRLFVNTIEPESSGICFENSNRQGPNASLYENKMEFILDEDFSNKGIDPWSTAYWEPEPKKQANDATAKMLPPAAPTNAFAALTAGSANSSSSTKVVKDEIMDGVKAAILNNKTLSKVGMTDVIYAQFRDQVTRLEVKNTIEWVAEKKKPSTGKTKIWELKPGHEITTQ